MSERHPIIAITGSSGAGTSTVTRTFSNIFRREGVKAAIIEGDSFHRYDRKEMKQRGAAAEKEGNKHFSHFSAENNLFGEIENLFRTYGATGQVPQIFAQCRRGSALPTRTRHVHPLGRPAERYRHAFLRGLAWCCGHA
jgi:phosphoribulokinase